MEGENYAVNRFGSAFGRKTGYHQINIKGHTVVGEFVQYCTQRTWNTTPFAQLLIYIISNRVKAILAFKYLQRKGRLKPQASLLQV